MQKDFSGNPRYHRRDRGWSEEFSTRMKPVLFGIGQGSSSPAIRELGWGEEIYQ